jgi:hypothetical protein
VGYCALLSLRRHRVVDSSTLQLWPNWLQSLLLGCTFAFSSSLSFDSSKVSISHIVLAVIDIWRSFFWTSRPDFVYILRRVLLPLQQLRHHRIPSPCGPTTSGTWRHKSIPKPVKGCCELYLSRCCWTLYVPPPAIRCPGSRCLTSLPADLLHLHPPPVPETARVLPQRRGSRRCRRSPS